MATSLAPRSPTTCLLLGLCAAGAGCGPGGEPQDAAALYDSTAAGVADPGYSVRLVGMSGLPDMLAPGEPYIVSVVLENNGSRPLDPASDRLVSRTNPLGLWSWQESRLPPGQLAPGARVVVSLVLYAPVQPAVKTTFAASLYHWHPNPDQRGFIGDRVSGLKDSAPLILRELVISEHAPRSFDARVVSADFSAALEPNDRGSFTVLLQNSGSQPWQGSGFGLYPAGRSALVVTPLRLGSGEVVGPGQSRRFVLAVRAPAEAGVYPVALQMRHTGFLGRFGELARAEVQVGCPDLGLSVVPSSLPRPRAYVEQLYLDLLHRPLDQAGAAALVPLSTDGPSRVAVARTLLGSSELHTTLVRGWYTELLHRVAEPGELPFLVSVLALGGTREQALSYLFGSDEYYAVAGGTDLGFLQSLYRDLLRRELDQAGQDTFLSLLGQGLDRSQIAGALLGSEEFLGRAVDLIFRGLVGHTPDPFARASLIAAMQSGAVRDEDLMAALLGSDEYLAALPDQYVDAGALQPVVLAELSGGPAGGMKAYLTWHEDQGVVSGRVERKDGAIYLSGDAPYVDPGKQRVRFEVYADRCLVGSGELKLGVR